MSAEFQQIAPNGVRNYKSNPSLKAAGVSFIFTREQIEERIRCTKDPIYFIEKYMKIVHVDRGLIPFELYDFQKTLLKSYIDNRFTIAKLPRQVGKSTVTVAYIMWTALFGPMQNIAILANKASTSRDILAKLQLAYEHIPLWMQQGIVSWNKGSIELENGSKIIAAATASSSARGNTYNCVSGDSSIRVKIDEYETSISISKLYDLIANSSKYTCQYSDETEIRYVHREQVQTHVHENCSKRFFAPAKREDGESPYNSTKSGRNRLSRKFGELTDPLSHSLSQITNQVCHRRTQKKHGVCLCDDDAYPTLSKNNQPRIGIFERLLERVVSWKASYRGDEEKNFGGKYGKIEEHTEDIRALSEYIQGTDWAKENCGAYCEDKQKPRENTQDGGGASWHEAVGGIEAANERSCSGANPVEQGEDWHIFFGNSGENETGEIKHPPYERAQREFEKIQVLTESGYRDFHGIKETKSQRVVTVLFESGEITCTPDHKLFSNIGYIDAKDSLGKSILNHDGNFHEVLDVKDAGIIDVYDLLEVSETHSYYCNNFLVHQCIFLDEFAFVPKNIAEEFITSVYPTISSGKTTKVIMVSTPNGMNLFYKYWTDAVNKRNLYTPVEAHWSVVPGRDEAWAEDQIKQLGEEKFEQEFGCSFLGSSNTLVSAAKLSSLVWVKPTQKFNDLDIYEMPQPNHLYVIAVDTSEGQGLDYSAFTVIDCTQAPYRLVAKYYNNKISPMVYPTVIYNVACKYNNAYVLAETNNIGMQVVEVLHNDLEYENIFSTTNMGRGGQKISSGFKKNSKFGIKMTTQIKTIGCANLKSMLETDKLLIQDFDTISELTSFVASHASFSAEAGCNDDLVMTLVLFSWLTTQPTFKELTDTDVRQKIVDEKLENMQEEILPFGVINDGADDMPQTFSDSEGNVWEEGSYLGVPDAEGFLWGEDEF